MQRGVEARRIACVALSYDLPMGEPGERSRRREGALAALALSHGLEEPGEVALPFEWRL